MAVAIEVLTSLARLVHGNDDHPLGDSKRLPTGLQMIPWRISGGFG